MIEPIKKEELSSLDFIQDITNQVIADKINEIIEVVNQQKIKEK